MPRYVVAMMNGDSIVSQDGTILPDLAAVRHLVCQRLAETMLAASSDNDKVELWADVFDDKGERVLATRLTFRVIEP